MTEFIRTPDENFAELADFPFQLRYRNWKDLRQHYIDEGPRDAPVMLLLHGMTGADRRWCMKWLFWCAVVAALGAGDVMAAEEAEYEVVLEDQAFEVRRYEPHIVAETLVDGDFAGAGNRAFSRLFGYISGENRKREDIAMTAPVTQEAAGEEIAMTAPVGQQRTDGRWAISFMMPASWSLEALPEPDDPAVTLRAVPGRYVAAVRYSGFWSERGYRRHLGELRSWMQEQGLEGIGDPVWARYNAPLVPWFLRRNEILIPVEWPSG